MSAAPPPNAQNNIDGSNGDVFSMTDDGLARRFQFQNEHGVGNWGSVWLAADKRTQETTQEKKVAIKVVHRSKTQTTAARVRALWNEMKTVRSLRENGECHPSIVAFDCFIITPSYALIVMEFLPTLLPVPVDENTAKPWMASLASAVEFMHSHGVVHNDIKPANILLSANNTPTLVDFGFSERYDATEGSSSSSSSQSHFFLSSLAYGTPEYLSPERAAGHMHDTRKADVWSLGITFFELLFNRTPFEHDRGVDNGGDDGTKGDGARGSVRADRAAMDAYWSCTMKGKWYGTGGNKLRWRMSAGLELLLRRMISPNADVRYTSTQVLKDPYWHDASGSRTKIVKKKSMMMGIPAIHVDPATPTQPSGTLSSMVRTVLGNKQNVMGVGKSVVPGVEVAEQNPAASPSGGLKGDGKENAVPRTPRAINVGGEGGLTKSKKDKSGARLAKPPVTVKPDEPESTLPVEQEAQRVREIAADTRVDRMAIWVQNVERVVEDAKKIVARGDSQPLLPPLPRVPSPDDGLATSHTGAQASTSAPPPECPSPSPVPCAAPSPASRSAVIRPRADHIFAAAPPSSAHRRAIAIGNSVDLNAPVQVLRHVVSADYPFNGKAIDGQGNDGERVGDGVKVVVDNRAGIRKIKSDLVKGHARTVSYNSMYLGKGHPAPVPVIPEVRIEDADDVEKRAQIIFASNGVEAKLIPPADPELFYDKLIVGTNAVERMGKGYQSNLCTQNDHTTLRKSALTPTSMAAGPASNSIKHKLSASNFFLSMRPGRPCDAEEASIRAYGTPPISACPPARPRRRLRQAASFDGFRNFSRPEKGQPQAPNRPVSEHLPPTPTRDTCGATSKGEKKRTIVTKTMRKAFFAIIGSGGGGGVEKAH